MKYASGYAPHSGAVTAADIRTVAEQVRNASAELDRAYQAGRVGRAAYAELRDRLQSGARNMATFGEMLTDGWQVSPICTQAARLAVAAVNEKIGRCRANRERSAWDRDPRTRLRELKLHEIEGL